MKISAHNLSKRFGLRPIFKNISFKVEPQSALAITGPNGSGKSTLLKVLTGLVIPNSGKVEFTKDGSVLNREQVRPLIAYVTPEMNLYEELSGLENLRFFLQVSGRSKTAQEYESALEQAGLKGRGDDFVKGYSSGMKMRLKYALAILLEPHILFLDEPTTNLDNTGRGMVYAMMKKQVENNILIYATNEKDELQFAHAQIELDK